MISTEMIIVMLIFLIYIAVWYGYMRNFMGVAEHGVHTLDDKYYADLISYKINVLCMGDGKIGINLGKEVNVSAEGDKIIVNSIQRYVKCNTTGEMHGAVIELTKKDNGVIIS